MIKTTYIDFLQSKRNLRLPIKVSMAGFFVSDVCTTSTRHYQNFELTLRLESSEKTALDIMDGVEYHSPFPHYVLKMQGLHHTYALHHYRRAIFFIFPYEIQRVLMDYGLLQIPLIGGFDFSGRLAEEINHVQELMRHSRESYVADKIDLSVFQIFHELFFQQKMAKKSDWDHHERMKEIASYLENTLGEPHSMESLAKRFGYSQRSLFRYWRESFQMSPMQYVQAQKIKRAEYLLRNTAMTVGEISRQLSFGDDNYFSAAFRKHVGLSPRDYRRQAPQESPTNSDMTEHG